MCLLSTEKTNDEGSFQMKNKRFVVLLGILLMGLVFISTVSAEVLKTGRYATDAYGLTFFFRFHIGGKVQICPSDSPNRVLGEGRYNISGNRLTITFGQIGNADLHNLSERTFIYSIQDDESFTGYDEQWVRIGN
jgi:hypothetical protein